MGTYRAALTNRTELAHLEATRAWTRGERAQARHHRARTAAFTAVTIAAAAITARVVTR